MFHKYKRLKRETDIRQIRHEQHPYFFGSELQIMSKKNGSCAYWRFLYKLRKQAVQKLLFSPHVRSRGRRKWRSCLTQLFLLGEKAAKAVCVYIVDLDSKTQSASSDAPSFPCNAVSANPYPPPFLLLPWPRGGSRWVRGRPSLRSATRLARLAMVHVDCWCMDKRQLLCGLKDLLHILTMSTPTAVKVLHAKP